jgi:hypothetical protein
MKSVAAPPCLACDTATPLTSASAKTLAASVYDGKPIAGVCRYISLGKEGPGDLTAAEAEAITGAGLGLWIIQHPYRPGWAPSKALAQLDGAWAARNTVAVGYPSGCHLAIDLEGLAMGTPKQDVIEYVETRAALAMSIGGFPSLLYIGFDAILSVAELAALPSIHLYWDDFGGTSAHSPDGDRAVRVLPGRGFAIRQYAPDVVVGGVHVDLNAVAPDAHGGQLVWAVRE